MQERRLAEAEHFAKNKDLRKKLFEKGIDELGHGLEEVKNISEDKRRQMMLKHLSEKEKTQIEMLQKIKPRLSQYSQQVVDNIIAEQTRRVHEYIKALKAEDQAPFEPIRQRRFIIISPEARVSGYENSPSSSDIITAENMPMPRHNMVIRFIGN
jgi:hypothetical protein